MANAGVNNDQKQIQLSPEESTKRHENADKSKNTQDKTPKDVVVGSNNTQNHIIDSATSNENEPPRKVPTSMTSSRGNRGARRGKAPWYRGRRGRGGSRSMSSGGASQV
jgi:hypothetical protein